MEINPVISRNSGFEGMRNLREDAILASDRSLSGASLEDSPKTSEFNTLKDFFNTVNSVQKKAENSALAFSLGEADNIHRVMIDMEESNMATKLFVQVRNKAVEAYQEVMRMQV